MVGHGTDRVRAVHTAALAAAVAELRPGDLDRRAHALHHVVGIDQERRLRPQRGHLRFESGSLGVVHEREGVRAGAGRGYVVAAPGLQVGGRAEADDVRGPCGGAGTSSAQSR